MPPLASTLSTPEVFPVAPAFHSAVITIKMHATLQNLIESIDTLFIGLGFVLFVLAFIYALCALVGSFFIRAETAANAQKEAQRAGNVPAVSPANKHAAASVEKETIVAIAAALDQVLGQSQYRIISIRPPKHLIWVEQGRVDIFRSHRTL